MQYELRSDLAVDGRDEEGYDIIREVFYLIARDEIGNQLRSPHLNADWTDYFRRDKRRTELEADKIMMAPSRWCPMMVYACGQIALNLHNLKEGQTLINHAEPLLDHSDWQPTDPQYGSIAYEQDIHYIVEREKQEDLMWNR